VSFARWLKFYYTTKVQVADNEGLFTEGILLLIPGNCIRLRQKHESLCRMVPYLCREILKMSLQGNFSIDIDFNQANFEENGISRSCRNGK
jgi:hypothetical protein